MTLSALSTAAAGLKATQAAIGIVSQNVANAGTAGYTKRTLTAVAGVGNSSVATGTVARSFDAAALRQLRLETSGSGYTATRADVSAQVDRLFGTPGSATALDGLVNGFTLSLQTLAANPTVSAARSGVLDAASALASSINGIASGVQGLRTGIEAQLATDTRSASALLSGIASLNLKIQGASDPAARADLEDQRDQQITQLSAYMDVQTVAQRDGTVSVMTSTGATLVDRGNAATLTFDARSSLGPNSAYSTDSASRSVGTITATMPGSGSIDLGAPGVLRSGSMAAQLELRDSVLPQVQRQLDDLAAGLASALTDRSVTGTVSGTAATIDLSGIQAGNSLTLPVSLPDGSVRNVVLVASNKASASVDPALTDDATAFAQTFDISGGPATYAAKIQEALDAVAGRAAAQGYPAASIPTLTASGGSASVTVTGSAGTRVTGASAAITVPTSATDLSSAYPQIALFVDGSGNRLVTGTLDAGAQRIGLAQRLTVNPAVTAKTSVLTASDAAATGTDGTRASFVYDALTSAQKTFSSSSGIGGVSAPHTTTVAAFAQDVIAAQGAAADQARNLDDGQSVALSTAQSRFSTSAGVSVDEEMANLIALQQAYSANARVLTAARDMLDTLLRL